MGLARVLVGHRVGENALHPPRPGRCRKQHNPAHPVVEQGLALGGQRHVRAVALPQSGGLRSGMKEIQRVGVGREGAIKVGGMEVQVGQGIPVGVVIEQFSQFAQGVEALGFQAEGRGASSASRASSCSGGFRGHLDGGMVQIVPESGGDRPCPEGPVQGAVHQQAGAYVR